MSRKLMIPRSSNESNNFIIKRMINDRFFNLVGITRAWRSTSPSCQREHRHKTNVKDEDWQHLGTGANHRKSSWPPLRVDMPIIWPRRQKLLVNDAPRRLGPFDRSRARAVR